MHHYRPSSCYLRLILPTREAFEEYAAVENLLAKIQLTPKHLIEQVVLYIAQSSGPEASRIYALQAARLYALPYQAVTTLVSDNVYQMPIFNALDERDQHDISIVVENIVLRAYIHLSQLFEMFDINDRQQELMSFSGWQGYDLIIEIPNT